MAGRGGHRTKKRLKNNVLGRCATVSLISTITGQSLSDVACSAGNTHVQSACAVEGFWKYQTSPCQHLSQGNASAPAELSL